MKGVGGAKARRKEGWPGRFGALRIDFSQLCPSVFLGRLSKTRGTSCVKLYRDRTPVMKRGCSISKSCFQCFLTCKQHWCIISLSKPVLCIPSAVSGYQLIWIWQRQIHSTNAHFRDKSNTAELKSLKNTRCLWRSATINAWTHPSWSLRFYIIKAKLPCEAYTVHLSSTFKNYKQNTNQTSPRVRTWNVMSHKYKQMK